MANFITDDICEEVTICDPNEIIQDCLPEGEDLECLYTLDFDVPWWFQRVRRRACPLQVTDGIGSRT